jgi:hypothetical protein
MLRWPLPSETGDYFTHLAGFLWERHVTLGSVQYTHSTVVCPCLCPLCHLPFISSVFLPPIGPCPPALYPPISLFSTAFSHFPYSCLLQTPPPTCGPVPSNPLTQPPNTVYPDEHDRCKQYNNFIPIIDTALFSMAMDRGCSNAAVNK